MKLKFILISWSLVCQALIWTGTCFAQPKTKLVIGLVIDQMRYDYLSRFHDKFSSNGFRRLIDKGYECSYVHINYLPPLTAPGHASIFTGSIPAIHGIVGNSWFDNHTLLQTYCVEDRTETAVGSNSRVGQVSPRNLTVTTIGDELKLNSGNRSKVFGISLKDRGAILSAGLNADGAYFFDDYAKCFITLSYYMTNLPQWVNDFNKNISNNYFRDTKWTTSLPINNYVESESDSSMYEVMFKKEGKPIFPHEFSNPTAALMSSPLGNKFVLDFAKEAILSEKLGERNATDLLTISLSAPGYIGHQYGPRSVEIEDCYIKLDLVIADFLTFLDKTLGKANYTIFVTSDHGVADNARYAMDERLPGGLVILERDINQLENSLKLSFGDYNWIKSLINKH